MRGFTRIDTRSQILVYAVVFGAAQTSSTTFIDNRSDKLLEAVTSIDSDDTEDDTRPPPTR